MLKYLFFFCLAFFGAQMVSTVSASNPVFISEINFAGSNAQNHCKLEESNNRCGFDKWVEITNPNDSIQSLAGWKLKFNEGNGTNEWFVFPAETSIAAYSSIIVGYTEVNFISTLELSGMHADLTSYSLLRVSNNDLHTIHIALIDVENQIVDSAYMDTSVYPIHNFKYSLERKDGEWVASVNEFYPGNYGTPGTYSYFAIKKDTVAESSVGEIVDTVSYVSKTSFVQAQSVIESSETIVAKDNYNDTLVSELSGHISTEAVLEQIKPANSTGARTQTHLPFIKDKSIVVTPVNSFNPVVIQQIFPKTTTSLSLEILIVIAFSGLYFSPNSPSSLLNKQNSRLSESFAV